MDAVDVYCFSGTGNTLLAARALSERLAELGVDVRLRPLERCDPAAVDPSRCVGIACPVAVQSTYPPVWRFVEALPRRRRRTGAFLLDTLQMYSGGILGPMRHLLQRKGYRPLGAVELRMPGNFYRSAPDEQGDARRVASACDRARTFAEDLADGTANWPRPHVHEWALYAISRAFYARGGLVRRMAPLAAEADRCTRCGLCQRLCPTGSIDYDADGLPRFADRCVACMRCFSYCPPEAITLGGRDYHRNRPVKAAEFLHDDLRR